MSGHMSNSKASEVGRTYDWTDADWSPNNVHANRSYINMSHIIEQLLHLTVAHLQMHLTQFIQHYNYIIMVKQANKQQIILHYMYTKNRCGL